MFSSPRNEAFRTACATESHCTLYSSWLLPCEYVNQRCHPELLFCYPQGRLGTYIADDFTFISSNLDKIARGKAAYIEGAGCFFRLTTSVEVTHLILEGNTACAVARYQLRSPKGNTDVCDVAEILTVNVDKTDSSKIFFDTKAFQDFVAQG